MSLSNRDRIRKAQDVLKVGLRPFVERECRAVMGEAWQDQILAEIRGLRAGDDGGLHWDTQAILKVMIDRWNAVFRRTLGAVERAHVSLLMEVRNKEAHDGVFTSQDVLRALDSMVILMDSVSAAEQATELRRMVEDVNRTVFQEQARNKVRYQQMLEGTPQAGLKPWRELATPHPDVQSGRYMQAEFAADLWQVKKGEGSVEYRDPVEFFRRTYITAGMRDLLTGALQRLSGGAGDPVLELQTNFGGGKTHAMLALYHLFGGVESSKLDGLEPILKDATVTQAPTAKRAVLVGTALSVGEVSQKPDGTRVRTLWGELAWQLGGREGYDMVADSDQHSTSPGSDGLARLFKKFGPCLVLIDEWVAYARQLRQELPGGSFESQVTFAQALTEAAKQAPRTLLVASIPASKIEIGGDAGEMALDMLKNVFDRVAKPWRPATGDEGFEIVRRRLFEPMAGRDSFAARDAVLHAFAKLYKDNPADFPSDSNESLFREAMAKSYPIHPELFRRLYDDWSTLDKFQRTRGVLRLLAKVIHRLWESQDAGLLILPSSVPMDDHAVKSELTRYLDDVWEPIISQDVDGPESMPLSIDRNGGERFGRVSAARRVARALYIGTAPGASGKNPGIGIERVMLACVQPGEAIATFGDALRRVSDQGRYVHQDANRYWLSTRPNLNRTADDRAADCLRERETLLMDIVKRLQEDRSRGQFSAVHVCPASTAEVPDEPAARLVILRPEDSHARGRSDSPAITAAQGFLAKRGNGPRINQNAITFLAADKKELESLLEAAAWHRAWNSILKDKQSLNLDEFQKSQAESKVKEFNQAVELRIAATWIWALVPQQRKATEPVTWEAVKCSGDDALPARVSKKLASEELLIASLAAVRLRMALDEHLWQDRLHVSVADLQEWFARYLYLPRVASPATIEAAVADRKSLLSDEETFSLADAFDQQANRYVGLRVGHLVAQAAIGRGTLLVKPSVARAQVDRERVEQPAGPVDSMSPAVPHQGGRASVAGAPGAAGAPAAPPKAPALPTSYFGSKKLDAARIGSAAGQIAEEVLQHLSTLPGAQVEVRIEIQVRVPKGIPEQARRVVGENARSLKFDSSEFSD